MKQAMIVLTLWMLSQNAHSQSVKLEELNGNAPTHSGNVMQRPVFVSITGQLVYNSALAGAMRGPHPPTKTEWVNVFTTSYYFWRNWIKAVLIEGKIKKYRFVKDEVGYTGNIAIDKPEVDAAKKVLATYKTKNPDKVEMWS